jgi:hypothetical protein
MQVVDRVGRNESDLVATTCKPRVALMAARDSELASALDDLMLFRGKRVFSTISGAGGGPR